MITNEYKDFFHTVGNSYTLDLNEKKLKCGTPISTPDPSYIMIGKLSVDELTEIYKNSRKILSEYIKNEQFDLVDEFLANCDNTQLLISMSVCSDNFPFVKESKLAESLLKYKDELVLLVEYSKSFRRKNKIKPQFRVKGKVFISPK